MKKTPPVQSARPRTKGGQAARNQRVAASIVKGRSVSAIAQDERVSRATASRVTNSPEVQLLVTSLVEEQRGAIRALFTKALAAVEDSFTATRSTVYLGKAGPAAVELGPDHYARLTGVKRLTELLTAGRQAQKPEPPPKRTFTLEQLKAALAEEKTARPN